MEYIGYILIGLVVAFALYAVGGYNSLVSLRNQVEEAFSTMDVYLTKRYDLIPNLVETVKGYAKHEKETLEAVISARNKAVNATTMEGKIEAENAMSGVIGRLFALAESYPDLKANTNFLDLQSQLKDIEDKIAYSRQFYNDSVLSYNNKVEMFPSNIIAGMFNFKTEKFFEASNEEKENVQVKF